MDISCVILTWNSEKFIRKCLEALIADLKSNKFSHEIFIVDNGSKDRTVQIIKSFKSEYPDHIIPILLKKNTGTTYSRNLALKRASGKFIVIMDSDVEIGPGVTKELITTLDDDKKTGLIAPKLVYPDGKLQKSNDIFPTIFTKIFRFLFLKTIEKRMERNENKSKLNDVDYAISAMWVLRKEVLEKVGYLDENIFYAPEDVDFCLRLWLSGYRVVNDTRVTAIHHAQEISRGLKISKTTLSHIKGLSYFFRKHRYIFRPPAGAKKQHNLLI